MVRLEDEDSCDLSCMHDNSNFENHYGPWTEHGLNAFDQIQLDFPVD